MYQTEENQTSYLDQNEAPKKQGMGMPALQYGFITAVALIALTLIIYFLSLQAMTWVSWIGYVILLGGIFIGSKAFRDESNGGYITYGRALGFGTLLSVFAAVLISVFTYIFYKFLAPDALNAIREVAEERMMRTNPNMTDEQYEMTLKFAASPAMLTFGSLVGYIFIGFVLSLVTSAVVQRKDPEELL